MVKCEDCALMKIFGKPHENYWNRCTLLNLWDLDLAEERDCIDFQPGP